jgi:hypothetical protein
MAPSASGRLPPVLWIGPAGDGGELALARSWIEARAEVLTATSPEAAVAAGAVAIAVRSPAVILLASPAAVSWSLADCIAVSRRWPLAPLVSVAATLVEGRRRSGPPLPGIEEVAWNELPGRLAWWLRDRAAGVPGGLGMPATARREERLLEASRRVASTRPSRPARVEVAADRALDAESVADLVVAAGHAVIGRRVGRPPIDHAADAVVWDAGDLSPAHLTWTGLLAAHRPGAAIILLDSFPRADTAAAAVRMGATGVLSRPASLESLSGLLLDLPAACGSAGGRG